MKTPEQTIRQILRLCQKHNYRRVSFGVAHKSIPQSVSFCFGPDGSIFAWPENKRTQIGNWPAIWRIVEMAGLKSGCGNSHQTQVRVEGAAPQVWHLIEGKWKRII